MFKEGCTVGTGADGDTLKHARAVATWGDKDAVQMLRFGEVERERYGKCRRTAPCAVVIRGVVAVKGMGNRRTFTIAFRR